MKYSTDYHDYVFKDGKLIGKFEEMYRFSSEIPWHQDKTAYDVFSDIDIAILRQHKYESICEIGCGLGYFSNRLHTELDSGGRPLVTGVDISQIAVEKARRKFPEISFIVGDLTKEPPFTHKPLAMSDELLSINHEPSATSHELLPMSHQPFNLVVIKEVLWYVCHNLEHFIKNVLSMIKEDGFLYVSQSFLESDNWVGKDVIDSPERLKELLSQYVEPIHWCIEWNIDKYKNGHLHYLGRKV